MQTHGYFAVKTILGAAIKKLHEKDQKVEVNKARKLPLAVLIHGDFEITIQIRQFWKSRK